MSDRTVIAVVSELRASGLTVGQQCLVDELILLVADLQARSDLVGFQRERWREQKRNSRDVSGIPRTPHTPRDINNFKKISPPPPLETNLFSEWYEVYPRRKARRGAEKAYRHALKRGATHENLLAGAKRYAAECSGREEEYIKMPATWLNNDCWLDGPAKVLRFEASQPKRSWAEIKAERERMKEQGNEIG